MSLPKDKLYSLIEKLDTKDIENLVDITEALIIKRETESKKITEESVQNQEFDPEMFRGMLKHLNIDAAKESRKLRDQWKRDTY